MQRANASNLRVKNLASVADDRLQPQTCSGLIVLCQMRGSPIPSALLWGLFSGALAAAVKWGILTGGASTVQQQQFTFDDPAARLLEAGPTHGDIPCDAGIRALLGGSHAVTANGLVLVAGRIDGGRIR